jgi:hypothetical protein
MISIMSIKLAFCVLLMSADAFRSLSSFRRTAALTAHDGTDKQKPESVVEDDGYSLSSENKSKNGFLGKLTNSLGRRFLKWTGRQPKIGNLILVRHGESRWNYNRLFTGWVDVDLSERGRREVEHAARLILLVQ